MRTVSPTAECFVAFSGITYLMGADTIHALLPGNQQNQVMHDEQVSLATGQRRIF